MVNVRKDHAGPPAPLAESWRRIEAWLDEHLPAVKGSLRPGASNHSGILRTVSPKKKRVASADKPSRRNALPVFDCCATPFSATG